MIHDSNLKNSFDTSFEDAFARLEEILEKMNQATISLDDSLKLYEEADQLISFCSKKLSEAECKIEVLIKNRKGELITGKDDQPIIENYIVP